MNELERELDKGVKWDSIFEEFAKIPPMNESAIIRMVDPALEQAIEIEYVPMATKSSPEDETYSQGYLDEKKQILECIKITAKGREFRDLTRIVKVVGAAFANAIDDMGVFQRDRVEFIQDQLGAGGVRYVRGSCRFNYEERLVSLNIVADSETVDIRELDEQGRTYALEMPESDRLKVDQALRKAIAVRLQAEKQYSGK